MIRAGEVIVREGQTITNEIYEKLDLVGLLDEQSNIYPVIGLALLIIMICSFITIEMHHLSKQNKWSLEKMLAIFFISMIVVSLMKIISVYTTQSNQLFSLPQLPRGYTN